MLPRTFDDLGDFIDVGRCHGSSKGIPWASVITWCSLPPLPRSVGLGPVIDASFAKAPEGGEDKARSQSIGSAPLSSASNIACSLTQTPAWCQVRRYSRQVLPQPQPSSAGRSSQAILVLRTNRIPVRMLRALRTVAAEAEPAVTGYRSQVAPGWSGKQSPNHQAAARVPNAINFSFFPNALRELPRD
jgi:hypothetical protein